MGRGSRSACAASAGPSGACSHESSRELQRIELEVEPAAARVHLDSTIVKVHQDGTGAPRQRGGASARPLTWGLTTKPARHRARWRSAGRWSRLRIRTGPRRRARPLDRAAHRDRNLVERFFNRLKRFRGIATRYHKLDVVYLHMICLACIFIMTK